MTMIYEITGAGVGRIHVDARPHGVEEGTKGVFYDVNPEYVTGYIAGVVAGLHYECEGDLDDSENRTELLVALLEYLKSNLVEVPA